MRTSIIILFLMISTGLMAETPRAARKCLERLTANLRYDSRSFNIEYGHKDYDRFGNDFVGLSYRIIKDLLIKVQCFESALSFARTPFGPSTSKCILIIPGKEESLSCYVESNIGYFFITKDYQTKAHIVFSRWD